VLTISSGGSIVATIDFAGAYVTSDFHLSGGSGGSGTIITDPTVVGGGVQSANIALLGNYIAAGFVTAAGGHGGTIISEAAQSVNQQPLLTHPHA
jgi:hypothetical protein